MSQKYVSIKEYSELTGIGRNTLYKLVKEGKLNNACKIGGRILVIIDEEPVKEVEEIDKQELLNEIETLELTYNRIFKILKSIVKASK